MKPNEYFAWALNVCLCANAGGMFVDLVPEDGVLRSLTPTEELVLGQSLEKIARSRMKEFGTVSRIQCGEQTTPEIFYLGVVHALRQVEAWAQTERDVADKQQVSPSTIGSSKPSNASIVSASPFKLDSKPRLQTPPALVTSEVPPGSTVETAQEDSTRRKRFAPHILIIQDIDQAPVRTLQCIAEMLHCKRLSVPPPSSTATASASSGVTTALPGVSLLEPIDLPPHFLLVASSCRLPIPSMASQPISASVTMIPDRLMSGFLLRVPICFPAGPPKSTLPPTTAATTATTATTTTCTLLTRVDFLALLECKVYVNPTLVRHVRMTCARLGQHPKVACNVSPQAVDALLMTIRAQASLATRDFAIPDDYYACVIETLAHRLIVLTNAGEDTWYQTRLLLASVVSSMQTLK
ncbi:hypothetical protein BASA81_001459 [Batrachochytrium salamandrivorans]|nr:hypothetical protein BASA81_001459 [Batrachochytrium salamandrivorans]